jgi:hypothetical protein
MPDVGELPDDLKPLVRRNALEIGHSRFDADSERLAIALQRALLKAREQRESKLALPEGYRLDSYVIEAVLGSGGFGITYLAEIPLWRAGWPSRSFYPGTLRPGWATQRLSPRGENLTVRTSNGRERAF